MKKFKKFIAIMLAAVLFAGTGLMDMGVKEVQAEMTFEDSFDFVVDMPESLEADQDVVLNISVTNNKDISCTLNLFNHFYYENPDATGEPWGELVLLGEDGADDIVITDENLSDVSFEPLQTKEFTLTATVPDNWNDTSEIFFIVMADSTDENYPDTTLSGQYYFTAGGSGEDEDEDGLLDPDLDPIVVELMLQDGEELIPGESVKLDFGIMNNTTDRASYTAEFQYVTPDGTEDAVVKVCKDWGEDGIEDVTNYLSDFGILPGEIFELFVEWTVPENWEEGSSLLSVTVTDGTNSSTQEWYGESGDEGEDNWGDEEFTPDPDLAPIALYFGPVDDDVYELEPGQTVQFWFEIMNNTMEKTNYTAEFQYISPAGIEDTDVKLYRDNDEEGSELIEDLSALDFEPGVWEPLYFEWEVPESWEEGRCNFHATVTDGTNTTTVDWPGGYINTYEYGDVAFKDIRIAAEDRDDIQFNADEDFKKIPVEFEVETKNGWELETVDFYYYSAKERKYLPIDEQKVEKLSETTYKAYLEVNKYACQDIYILQGFDLGFAKPYGYDVDYDGEITEEDCEKVEICYWGELDYDYDDGEYHVIPPSEEQPAVFWGEDEYYSETPDYEYKGQADFTVTKSAVDEKVPLIEDIELLTDPDSIDEYSSVSVKVNYEEYGSGVKEIALSWVNSDEDWITEAYWSADKIEENTGKGSVVLSTEEGDEEWYEPIWYDNDEYFISEIIITDWAGNEIIYDVSHRGDYKCLANLRYGFNEEIDEYGEIYEEFWNVSFSRGNKHLYGPIALEKSERADAAKKTNGKAYKQCLICGKESSSKATIYYPKYYSIDNGIYTGDPVGCGEIVIKDTKKKVVHPAYYEVEFTDNATSVGKHKVKIYFGGNYWGTVTKSYVIVPAAVPEVSAEVSGGHNDVKVSWEKSTGASGYYVSWGKVSYDEYGDPYVKDWSSQKSTTKTYYTAKDLSADKNYMFRVVPYYKSGDTKYYETSQYNYVECKTKKNVKAPSSVTAKLNGVYNDVSLSWKKSTGADGYNVYYKLGSEDYELLTTTTSLKTTEAVGLEDGGKYTFKVVPYYLEDGEEIESAYSKTTTVYIMKAPGTAKVTRYSSSKVKVAWTNISGESGYQISKSEDPAVDGTLTTYSTTSGKSKTITAKKNVTYYYKVRAYKTVDGKKIYGPWSEVTEYTRTR